MRHSVASTEQWSDGSWVGGEARLDNSMFWKIQSNGPRRPNRALQCHLFPSIPALAPQPKTKFSIQHKSVAKRDDLRETKAKTKTTDYMIMRNRRHWQRK